jgi:hypothetical protein
MVCVGRSRRRVKGRIHTREHFTTIPTMRRRTLLIWQLVHLSSQLVHFDFNPIEPQPISSNTLNIDEKSKLHFKSQISDFNAKIRANANDNMNVS